MEQPTTQPAAPVTPVVTQPAKKKSNTLVIILAVVFGILALCGGVVVFSFFKAKDLLKNSDFVNEVKQQVENQNNNDYEGTNDGSQDSSDNDTTKPATDTCSYMSKAQLSAAIGKNITTETSDGDKRTCTYTTDPSNYTDAVIMIVSVETPTAGQTSKSYIDIIKNTVFSGNFETMSVKSADTALWSADAKMLVASKGNKVLLIAVQTLSDKDYSKEHAQKAADYLMPKL